MGLFYWREIMSWFKHRPKPKEPSRLTPYRSSPLTDKILQNIKEEVRKPTGSESKMPNKD